MWPERYDGRAVIGKSYNDYKADVSDEENIEKFKDALAKGDESRRTVWAYVPFFSTRPMGKLI